MLSTMSDWTTEAVDTVEKGRRLVRDKTVEPAQRVTRALVFGFLTAFFVFTAILLLSIGVFRLRRRLRARRRVGGVAGLRWNLRDRRGVVVRATVRPADTRPGRTAEVAMTEPRDVVIVGSGPAGLTAAVYAARANLHPIVIEGLAAGGQLMLTTDVENFPGFPDGIMGPELMMKFREQAARFGTEFVTADADRVDLSAAPFGVWVDGTEYRGRVDHHLDRRQGAHARAAVGAATCSGTACRRAPRATASSSGSRRSPSSAAATPRSRRRCSSRSSRQKVTVIHRRDELRASKIMQDRAFANPKIELALEHGRDRGARRREARGAPAARHVTGDESVLPVGGLFVAIGHDPNTALFEGQLELDENGYIMLPTAGSTRTSVDGVFAAGDVADHVYRQAITAAGTGCMAAIEAERWLEGQAHAELPAAAAHG